MATTYAATPGQAATARAERLRALALTRVTGTLVADAQVRKCSSPPGVLISVRVTQGCGTDWLAEQLRPDTSAHWIAARSLANALRRDTVVTIHARGARPATRNGERVQMLINVEMIEALDIHRRGAST